MDQRWTKAVDLNTNDVHRRWCTTAKEFQSLCYFV